MPLAPAGLARFDGCQLGPNFLGAGCLCEQNSAPIEPRLRRYRFMRFCRWILLSAAWLGAVSASLWWLLEFEMTPAAVGQCPELWPQNSVLVHSFERPTLLMFVHPRCPCSRASVDELARLATACGDDLRMTVVFLKPRGFAGDWEKTDLWRSARQIPGVTVFCDEEGKETTRFRACVSGEVLVYDPQGRLTFHGGLTASRGHHGDNPGRTAIELLLAGKLTPPQQTPVFGCSLIERTSTLRHSP
jgi:hypothetical protein